MKQPALIARLAGQSIAMAADAIETVTTIDRIAPVPGTAPAIAGLAPLRSQIMTVIDCAMVITGERQPADEEKIAAVVRRKGHLYALLLSGVDDVTDLYAEPAPLPCGFGDRWKGIATGLVETELGPLLLVDPFAFLASLNEKIAA
jgi:purine-binding chemotaxis protein CheW